MPQRILQRRLLLYRQRHEHRLCGVRFCWQLHFLLFRLHTEQLSRSLRPVDATRDGLLFQGIRIRQRFMQRLRLLFLQRAAHRLHRLSLLFWQLQQLLLRLQVKQYTGGFGLLLPHNPHRVRYQ